MCCVIHYVNMSVFRLKYVITHAKTHQIKVYKLPMKLIIAVDVANQEEFNVI